MSEMVCTHVSYGLCERCQAQYNEQRIAELEGELSAERKAREEAEEHLELMDKLRQEQNDRAEAAEFDIACHVEIAQREAAARFEAEKRMAIAEESSSATAVHVWQERIEAAEQLARDWNAKCEQWVRKYKELEQREAAARVEVERKLPCGHHHSMDDSYGGCVLCTYKDGYHEYEAALQVSEQRVKELERREIGRAGKLLLLQNRLAQIERENRELKEGWRQAKIHIEAETIERCEQLCYEERDKAKLKEPETNGSTMNADHLMGQGWMANLLGKKIRALQPNAAATQGGQPSLTSDSQESPTVGLAPAAAPDEDGHCKICGLAWPDEKETLEPHECPPGFMADWPFRVLE